GILGVFFIATIPYLFLFSLNLLLYIVFSNIVESRVANMIGNFLLISSLLAIIGFFTEVIIAMSFRINFLQVSGVISIIALLLFFIYYVYNILKEILQSIEIKLKK
ncbi:MAG: hypothetical protein QW714_02440, partial [Nanopusillaceae archaeon]